MTDLSDLPSSLQRFAAKYPKIWEKYSELGQESSLAGPLDGRLVQLIKVAIYASKRQETPFKTHVRLAIENGATAEEIDHTVLQILTAEGLGTTIRVWNWANSVIEDESRKAP